MNRTLATLGIAAFSALSAAVLSLPAGILLPSPFAATARADSAAEDWEMDAEMRRQIEAGRQREIDRRRETELALARQGQPRTSTVDGIESSVAGVCRTSGASTEPYIFFFSWPDPETGETVYHARWVYPSDC